MRPPLNKLTVVVRAGRRVKARSQGGYDTAAREPRLGRDVSGTEITLSVQWVERLRRRQKETVGGDEPQTSVYFLIHPDTLLAAETAAGATLAVGDQVYKKAGVVLTPRVYVTEIRDCGHQQVAGGRTLLQVFFSDRSPHAG